MRIGESAGSAGRMRGRPPRAADRSQGIHAGYRAPWGQSNKFPNRVVLHFAIGSRFLATPGFRFCAPARETKAAMNRSRSDPFRLSSLHPQVTDCHRRNHGIRTSEPPPRASAEPAGSSATGQRTAESLSPQDPRPAIRYQAGRRLTHKESRARQRDVVQVIFR